MKIMNKLINKIKSVTKEEIKESVKSHKAEIFCGVMTSIALLCLVGVKNGPRPNVTYVTVNMDRTEG